MLVIGKLSYNKPNIFIEAKAAERVKNFCSLGMNVDENMKYHSLVDVIQKNYQLAGMTFKIEKYVDLKSIKKLYIAFVYSTMK